MKLNKREQLVLKDIIYYAGSYSKFWTPKTNLSLQEKGLVIIDGCVKPTQKAMDLFG